jgi:hypothetical protein
MSNPGMLRHDPWPRPSAIDRTTTGLWNPLAHAFRLPARDRRLFRDRLVIGACSATGMVLM